MYFQLGENINIPNTKVSINDVALTVCIEQRLYNSDAQNVLCGFFFHYFMYCTVYYVKHYSSGVLKTIYYISSLNVDYFVFISEHV
jgi:hypothetical protein